MKVFITGHTSGIGLATYEYLKTLGYDVVGGSRRTGFDIKDPESYKAILDCDVFVNNAPDHTAQLQILKDVYSHWKGTPKTIINVGSAHRNHQLYRPASTIDYNVSKKALETYSFWISDNDYICRSMMYNPGHVATPLADKHVGEWPAEYSQERDKRLLPPDDCARTIEFMIASRSTYKEITEL